MISPDQNLGQASETSAVSIERQMELATKYGAAPSLINSFMSGQMSKEDQQFFLDQVGTMLAKRIFKFLIEPDDIEDVSQMVIKRWRVTLAEYKPLYEFKNNPW